VIEERLCARAVAAAGGAEDADGLRALVRVVVLRERDVEEAMCASALALASRLTAKADAWHLLALDLPDDPELSIHQPLSFRASAAAAAAAAAHVDMSRVWQAHAGAAVAAADAAQQDIVAGGGEEGLSAGLSWVASSARMAPVVCELAVCSLVSQVWAQAERLMPRADGVQTQSLVQVCQRASSRGHTCTESQGMHAPACACGMCVRTHAQYARTCARTFVCRVVCGCCIYAARARSLSLSHTHTHTHTHTERSGATGSMRGQGGRDGSSRLCCPRPRLSTPFLLRPGALCMVNTCVCVCVCVRSCVCACVCTMHVRMRACLCVPAFAGLCLRVRACVCSACVCVCVYLRAREPFCRGTSTG